MSVISWKLYFSMTTKTKFFLHIYFYQEEKKEITNQNHQSMQHIIWYIKSFAQIKIYRKANKKRSYVYQNIDTMCTWILQNSSEKRQIANKNYAMERMCACVRLNVRRSIRYYWCDFMFVICLFSWYIFKLFTANDKQPTSKNTHTHEHFQCKYNHCKYLYHH